VPEDGERDPAVTARGPARVAAVAQVFVEDVDAPVVSDEDAHHLTRSLRVRAGETVVAADGQGHWRRCRVSPVVAAHAPDGPIGAALLEADGPPEFDPQPETPVTVGFVPVKGDRPEWVVQKLTEIGVDRVAVLRSTRSVVRWEGERGDRALERLRRVARQAAAQSRRAWLPTVEGVWTVPELAAELAPGALALADPQATAATGPLSAMAVGPEGGWEPAELELEGIARVGLGPAILRAETAAVVAGTLLCALRDGTLRPW